MNKIPDFSILRIKKRDSAAAILLFAMLAVILLSGCGGGGGGGSATRGEAIPQQGGTTTPPPAAVTTGDVSGRILISTQGAGRTTLRPADPFLMKIPANTPQELEPPETGYATATNVTVSTSAKGALVSVPVDANGNWSIEDLPEGTQQFTISGNGKQAVFPITVVADKTNNNLALVSENDSGQWQVETQTIQGDGTNGYKKETHCNGNSDTVFESGIRDHHEAAGQTLRDLTDDGIVDQQFTDANDDGTPDGPVTSAGGEPASLPSNTAAQVNNSAPVLQEISSKDNRGKKDDAVSPGESLTLNASVSDPDNDSMTVHWTVEDAEGNDVTSQFISNPDIVSPTFSPPQGDFSKPGAYSVRADITDSSGLSAETSEKDIIITVDSPDNKTPHASIKANHTSGEAPLTVTFKCDAFDTDGSIVSYCWDMDKSNGIDQSDCDDTSPEITKTFISAGKYRVTCIVTDNKGAAAFAKRVVVVRKQKSPPSISDLTPSKTDAAPGETIPINISASDPDDDAFTVTFKTSGGTMTDTSYADGRVEWTAPATPGGYSITATARDADGQESERTIYIDVESSADRPPEITVTATPPSGYSPLTVSLHGSATDPDGGTLSYSWDFDDADGIQNNAAGADAVVTYGGPGTYMATLTVCEAQRACSSKKTEVVVSKPNSMPFISNCSAAASIAETGDTTALSITMCDDDFDDLTVNWSVSGGTLDSASELMPIWTLPVTQGTYIARATVTDGKSTPVQCETSVSVIPEAPDKRPLPPVEAAVTPGNGSNLITWTPSPSTDVDHYKLYRIENGTETLVDGNIPATSTNREDTGLSNGQIYQYKLVAVDRDGYESDPYTSDLTAQPRPEIEDTTPVGDEPGGGEYDQGNDVYVVPSEGDDSVDIIDGGTGEIVEDVPTDGQDGEPTGVPNDNPVYACTDTTRGLAYVTNKGSDTLAVINMATKRFETAIAVGDGPESCVVDPVTGDIYVGNKTAGTISVVDPVTRNVRNTIQAGNETVVCAIDPSDNTVFATSRPDKTVKFFDSRNLSLLKTVTLSSAPAGCAVFDDWDELYVPTPDLGQVQVISIPGGEIETPIETGGSPECKCTVNKTSKQIYITNKIKRTMQIINGATRQVEKELPITKRPGGTCGVDTTRNRICVANKDADTVSIMNNPLPATVSDTMWPPIPEACTATGKNGAVDLTWKDSNICITSWPTPPDCIITGFKIRRGLSLSGFYQDLVSLGKTAGTFTDSSAVNGTHYYYKISSMRKSGNESPVCMVDATPEGEIEEVIDPPGDGPCCIAHDEVRNIMYVANEETNTIDVINYDTYQVIRSIEVQDCCGDMTYDHITNKIYVTNKTSNKVTIIRGTDYVIDEVVEVGPPGGGGKCTINEHTNEIYITNDITNELIIYEPGQPIRRIVLQEPCPCNVEVNKVTNEIYVTNKTTNKVTIINGTDYIVEEIIDVGGEPGGCVINEQTNTTYITNEKTNEVVVYDRKSERIVKRITVGVKPVCKPCSVDETTNQVYITNEESGTITIIDGATNSVIDTIAIGKIPAGLFVDPDTRRIYALNTGSGNISVINNPAPAVPSDTTPPAAPSGVSATSDSGGIAITWLANTESDLNFYKVYRRTEAQGDFSAPLAVVTGTSYTDTTAATGTKYYYVLTATDFASNESARSDTMSGRIGLPSEITVGSFPMNVAVNEALNRIYVTNRDSNTLSIIDAVSNTVITTVPAGPLPVGVDVDSVTGKVYVTNFGSNNVSIFNGSTGAFIKNVLTGGSAVSGVTVDHTNAMYYVSHASLSAPFVLPINLNTDVAGAPIATRPGSIGIGFMGPTLRDIFVANSLDSSATVISPSGNSGTVRSTLQLMSQPADVVTSPDVIRTFISCSGAGVVAAIDNDMLNVYYIPVGLEPLGMGVDNTRHLAYVANASSGTVSVIDTHLRRVIGEIYVGGAPTDVGVHTGLNKIFVTQRSSGKVIVREGF